MPVLTEIAKNYLIKVPFIKRMAKKRHVTGFNQSEEGVQTIYDTYKRFTGFEGKNIIELGPGHTWGPAKKMKEAGAASVSIIDIERYIPDSVQEENPWLNYIIYPGGAMPLPADHFDLVLSYTVYEHLRQPETTIRETYRILKKGGMAIHLIDLGDHMYFKIDPAKQFNCLKYGSKTWDLMSRNRSIYVNRIRLSGWRQLHQQAGFSIAEEIPYIDEYSRELYEKGQLQYLSPLKSEDRFASNILLVVRK
ncbi:MAG: methyltransferase domain-containing protein [Sphingobacteriales bacterium]|nr:methyltransferase domain-containing protein [Sphingobacteriales bacterium]